MPRNLIVGQNKSLEAKPISSNNAQRILLVSLFFLITFKKSGPNIDSFSLHSRVTQLGVLSGLVRPDKRLNTARQKLKLICVTDCPYTLKPFEWQDAMQRRHCVVPQVITG
jgi:hypothetical protein